MLVIVMFFTVIKIKFVFAVFVYGIVIGKLVEKIERFLSEGSSRLSVAPLSFR